MNKHQKRGFTLIEVLIVMVIIAILVAILFPTLAVSRREALRVSWTDKIRQSTIGMQLYQIDYDDRFALARYNPDVEDSRFDRTWVQNVLPYTRDFDLYRCPVDQTRPQNFALFDPDITLGDSITRFYLASMRSNVGFNFVYLSPLYKQGTWNSRPRSSTDIESISKTILFGESAWEIKDGRPSGGGNYLIIPPCRYEGRNSIDSFGLYGIPDGDVFRSNLDWEDGKFDSNGGLYPWFSPKVNIAFADGHMARVSIDSVRRGCDVGNQWSGAIIDSSNYLWDLR